MSAPASAPVPAAAALACPQCGAPLPRAARWRTVACGWCGATVVHARAGVERASFAAALARAQSVDAVAAKGASLSEATDDGPSAGPDDGPSAGSSGIATAADRRDAPVEWRGRRYRALGGSDALLDARALGPAAQRIAWRLGADPARLRREAEALAAVRALDVRGADYFVQRLPEPLGVGPLRSGDDRLDGREALGLRLPPGRVGTLLDVWRAWPGGIDPRHGVWIWRRLLEVLGWLHGAGWAHGGVRPEHAAVHPADHGVTLVGWAEARPAGAGSPGPTDDLQRSAWTVRALLHGAAAGAPGVGPATPEPFGRLLRQAAEDAAFARRLGAAGLEAALTAAAAAAFGPPRFLTFDPAPRRT